ncbi:hypothetical protein RM780_10440 [Streptomyces sp. DSM 44917]|uniref:Uncharacterized protein n=1 Tax=Streptomyces boetiae TaxID=3075541 RepID=A0ABU2L799_9ACTN|nr:hypothetical protein [Streptomyces sp. DSM 44917]MDT0307380.1 hypothetical protein [Streptomyces sp. DSM 44917]
MEPISLAVLAALAGGAGGELGRQVWQGLSGIIRRTVRGGAEEAALDALEERPEDEARAGELERAIRERRAADAEFERALRLWEAQFRATLDADPEAAEALLAAVARHEGAEDGQGPRVHNDFRHATFNGPVQGSGTQHITYQQKP